MESYDTRSSSVFQQVHHELAQREVLRLTAPEAGLSLSLSQPTPMNPFDHDLKFEGEAFMDDPNNVLLPYTPGYDLSTFEDPFSYQSVPFEALIEDTSAAQNADTTASAELDNKLLGFGAPIQISAVLDDRGQTWPSMSAELYGMFFVAEDVFSKETGQPVERPLELTCYRRNLFQISGTVTLSRGCTHILNEQGQRIPIYDMSATLSALESIEGKATEIISVPWKTNTMTSSEDKAGQTPARLPLDLTMNPEFDSLVVQIPIAWKRLQFKHATANNGRRKGLQQHYVIQINIMATLATGESVKITEIQSGPVIVRGRSPRNFDSRKDVSLSERKIELKPRTMSNDTQISAKVATPVDPSALRTSYGYYNLNTIQPQVDLPDWASGEQPLSSPSIISPPQQMNKKMALSRPPPVPKWKPESKAAKPLSQAPIDLSLGEDEVVTRGVRKGLSSESPDVASSAHKMGSPVENGAADLLYEYFPLSVDDWMPPVDAIYRPHVVHHTIVPPDLKAQQVKSKTKRYFSADD